MTVADAIKWARSWLDDPGAPEPTTDAGRAANAFAYALWLVDLERQAALGLLAERGFDQGPLNTRIKVALDELPSTSVAEPVP